MSHMIQKLMVLNTQSYIYAGMVYVVDVVIKYWINTTEFLNVPSAML